MNPLELRDYLYIGGIILTGVVTFISTRHKLKEHIRDRHDDLKEQINQLKLDMKDLKSKDDLQQQVIDQMSKTNEELIPKLLNALNVKNNGRK